MSTTDITAIITAHHEGLLAGVSLRSLFEAVDAARAAGLVVEVLATLDNADEPTREIVAASSTSGVRILELALGDQGKVRNRAVEEAAGDYIAFLDGDDLWSRNWLVEAHRLCLTDPGRVVAHPELNWFFGNHDSLFFLPDQTDPGFDPAYLRQANPWDALCMAPVAAYRAHPFADRAVAAGFAYEDWHWNLETVDGGLVHRVAPDTIHFKRRRHGSQFAEASASGVLPRHSALHEYAWYAAREPDEQPDERQGESHDG